MTIKNPLTFQELLKRRTSRRKVIANGLGFAAAGALAACSPRLRASSSASGLASVAPSAEDRVIVPDGYLHHVVLRWGDSIHVGAASLDSSAVRAGALLSPAAAEEQTRQFGFNCDGMGFFERGNGRAVVCVNHEYPLPNLMFPGWADARRRRERGEFVSRHPDIVRYMQASVGLSVVELAREDRWRPVLESAINRRITAASPFVMSGPASEHGLLESGTDGESPVFGTLGNCAAGTTPWGTYLTAEENIDDFFGNGGQATFSSAALRAHGRFGFRRRDSAYRWEYADPRFDLARHPNEPFKFGWVAEIDPFDPSEPLKKRTALGRFKHEGATSTLTRDGRVAVYMGDDQAFEYFYKFVTAERLDATNKDANRDLLDHGTLYVARLDADGTGRWLPLVWNATGPLSPRNGFASQADVVLHCREAADRLGATPLDRPEDCTVDERSKRVYLSCTQNTARGGPRTEFAGRHVDAGTDAANPRAGNLYGHIIEFLEAEDDPGATRFQWDVFVLAGVPSHGELEVALDAAASRGLEPQVTYFGGYASANDLSPFSNPDNLAFDARGNLWIVTDGNERLGYNDGCFVCPTEGSYRGAVTQFMSGPVGAEICGCEFSADQRTLFLTVQHPGEAGTVERPQSQWPDGGRAVPRPSLIAIEAVDPNRKFGDA